MKKKLYVAMITMFLLGSMSVTVFAGTSSGDDELSIATTTKANFVVKDSDGNKFRVYGNSTIGGKSATVTTSFDTTLYKNGTNDIDGLSKKLSVQGAMKFYNSASYTSSTTSENVVSDENGHGYYSETYSGFVYNVNSVSGAHGFSFNGGSGSGASYTD